MLESLKKCKAIVMDKTGTVTEGKFAVREIVAFTEKSVDEVLALVMNRSIVDASNCSEYRCGGAA